MKPYKELVDESVKRLFYPFEISAWQGSFSNIVKGTSFGIGSCIYCNKDFENGDSIVSIQPFEKTTLESDIRSCTSKKNSVFHTACFAEIGLKLSLEERPKCPAILYDDNKYIENAKEAVLEKCAEEDKKSEQKEELERKSLSQSSNMIKSIDKTVVFLFYAINITLAICAIIAIIEQII